ncbi:hypothetical protein LGV59_21100 [Bacteroides fragilis]|nr:hypothetical protein [Bacteroides fragilis]
MAPKPIYIQTQTGNDLALDKNVLTSAYLDFSGGTDKIRYLLIGHVYKDNKGDSGQDSQRYNLNTI